MKEENREKKEKALSGPKGTSNLALYIHWPFCVSKCPYCDFNSHVRKEIKAESWAESYRTTLEHYAHEFPNRRIRSIFFGGGTPSLMPPALAQEILETIARLFALENDLEITLEANPNSMEAARFKEFKQSGINRLSLGVQALNDSDLHFLGRAHSSQEAKNALTHAAEQFENFSFDLIYARPNQSLESWKNELDEALAFNSPHLSLYQLTIEKGTPFYAAYQQAHFTLPSEEQAADLYSYTTERLESAQLTAYEISNYAKEHFECQHNLAYWNYEDYLGIGPGAHSRITHESGEKLAFMAIHHPEHWQRAVTENHHGEQQRNTLSTKEEIEEFLLMGLRLKKGITREQMNKRYHITPEQYFSPNSLELLQREKLLILDTESMRTTNKGRLVLNAVIEKLCTEII